MMKKESLAVAVNVVTAYRELGCAKPLFCDGAWSPLDLHDIYFQIEGLPAYEKVRVRVHLCSAYRATIRLILFNEKRTALCIYEL